MPSVKTKQNKSPAFDASYRHYEVDDCLPQCQAIKSGKVGFFAWTHGHYPGTLIDSSLLQGVPSIGYFDVVGRQDWGIPPHRNEGIEICFQATGESLLTVDEKPYQLKPNSLSLTRPWQLHSMGDPHLKAGRLIWIVLDVGVRRPNQAWRFPPWCVLTPSDQSELIKKLRGNEQPVWNANFKLCESFSRIAALLEKEKPDQEISNMRVQLNEMLLGLLELMRDQNVVTDETLTTERRAVRLFLNELESNPNLLAYPWTLEHMAEQCGMKRTTFSRYCRELTNTTPLEAVNRWRLAHAAKRLQNDREATITSIALESGYSSSQYFASKFTKLYGMNPRQWRDSSHSEGQF